jgi:hypothetical protein
LNSFAAALPGRAAGSAFYGLLDRVPLVLATSYANFGSQLDVAPHIHFVGPLREPVAPAPWPRRFPDRPFVLVSLSSIFQEQDATLQRICDALAPLPLEVLVTTGRGIAPEALAVSGCVEAQSFVPHDAVLPSVDLVVTHAGLGTSMYSAGTGVPCLCLAQRARPELQRRAPDGPGAGTHPLTNRNVGRNTRHGYGHAERPSPACGLSIIRGLREPLWRSDARR